MSDDTPWIRSSEAWVTAFVFATLGVLISVYNIFLHLRFWNAPKYQLWIVRILVIIPIYGITSFLAIRYIDAAAYFETIRDIYEAFVVYCFFKLLLAMMGGEKIWLAMIKRANASLEHAFPCCCLKPFTSHDNFRWWCERMTLQFCVVKPVMAFIHIIVLANNKEDEWFYVVFQMTIYNVSYSLALYALALFYYASREHLKPYNPVWKFLAVKTVVFLTFWQSLFVSIFPLGNKAEADAWNNFILCLEMFAFGLLHMRSFPGTEFMDEGKGGVALSRSGALKTLGKRVLNFSDIGKDMHNHFVQPGGPAPSKDPHQRALLNSRGESERQMDIRQDLEMLGVEDPEIDVEIEADRRRQERDEDEYPDADEYEPYERDLPIRAKRVDAI